MDSKNLISSLNDEQIEEIIEYAPEYSEENLQNIKNKFNSKTASNAAVKKRVRPKKIFTFVATLSAVLILLTGLVYAGVIDIKGIYASVFGDKAEYMTHYGETVTGGSEYDGIKLNLVSSIKEKNELVVFFTMTDTKSDRLAGDVDFHNSWSLDQGGGGNCSEVNYDAKTKTASFMLTSSGGSDNKVVNLSIKRFFIIHDIEDVKENINLYDLLSKNKATILPKGTVAINAGGNLSDDDMKNGMALLKRDEIAVPFSNIDWSQISNIGFVDGVLHIQTHTKNGNFSNIMGLNLVNSKGDVVASDSKSVGGLTLDANGNQLGEQYVEFVYNDITDISQLKGLTLNLSAMVYDNGVEGNWTASFKSPKVSGEINIPCTDKLRLGGEDITPRKISLSPLDLTIDYTSKLVGQDKQTETNKDIAFVTYADGTVVNLDFIEISNDMDKCKFKFSGPVVEIEKAKSVNINGKVINVK